jgi:hypothetical protein
MLRGSFLGCFNWQVDGRQSYYCENAHIIPSLFYDSLLKFSDEAEVFLDTRGPRGESDVNRNALVSGWSQSCSLLNNTDKRQYCSVHLNIFKVS